MKKVIYYLFIILVFISYIELLAQPGGPPCCGPPPLSNGGFKYQTVVRDKSGDLIKNTKISLKIGLGPLDLFNYAETFSVTTNEFGIVNLTIGSGTAITGEFGSLDWSIAYPISIYADITGGSNYEYLNSSMLMTVPYSLYSVRSWSTDLMTITSAQRDSIKNPKAGFQILNKDTKCLNYYNGNNWQEICGSAVKK